MKATFGYGLTAVAVCYCITACGTFGEPQSHDVTTPSVTTPAAVVPPPALVRPDGSCVSDVVDINHERPNLELVYQGAPGDMVQYDYQAAHGGSLGEDVFTLGEGDRRHVIGTRISNADLASVVVRRTSGGGEQQECVIMVH